MHHKLVTTIVNQLHHPQDPLWSYNHKPLTLIVAKRLGRMSTYHRSFGQRPAAQERKYPGAKLDQRTASYYLPVYRYAKVTLAPCIANHSIASFNDFTKIKTSFLLVFDGPQSSACKRSGVGTASPWPIRKQPKPGVSVPRGSDEEFGRD